MAMKISTFEDVLKNAAGEPRVHPNGFIQLDLDYSRIHRLHVWPAEPLRAQRTRHTVHDHIFDMSSTLLRGSLTNLKYKFSTFVNGYYQLHRAVSAPGGPATNLQPTGEYGDLFCMGGEVVHAGETYHHPAFELHDTLVSCAPTVTVIKRTRFVEKAAGPLVVVPRHVNPDNDFRRDKSGYSTDQLFKMIKQALAA